MFFEIDQNSNQKGNLNIQKVLVAQRGDVWGGKKASVKVMCMLKMKMILKERVCVLKMLGEITLLGLGVKHGIGGGFFPWG